jgi:DnaJ family protein C protein 3
MRFIALTSLLLLIANSPKESLLVSASTDSASGAGGLYPPGLLPLINRANVLLSSGQFNEAARIYSEAIGRDFLYMTTCVRSKLMTRRPIARRLLVIL